MPINLLMPVLMLLSYLPHYASFGLSSDHTRCRLMSASRRYRSFSVRILNYFSLLTPESATSFL